MRIRPKTVAAVAVVLVLGGALHKVLLHATGTVVRRERPGR